MAWDPLPRAEQSVRLARDSYILLRLIADREERTLTVVLQRAVTGYARAHHADLLAPPDRAGAPSG